MCALVSEVSYAFWPPEQPPQQQQPGGEGQACLPPLPDAGDADDEAAAQAMRDTLRQWSQRTVHWRDCVAAEERAPLLAALWHRLPPAGQLVCARSAVEQFEVLLAQYSGPRERQRWAQLLGCMQVRRGAA